VPDARPHSAVPAARRRKCHARDAGVIGPSVRNTAFAREGVRSRMRLRATGVQHDRVDTGSIRLHRGSPVPQGRSFLLRGRSRGATRSRSDTLQRRARTALLLRTYERSHPRTRCLGSCKCRLDSNHLNGEAARPAPRVDRAALHANPRRSRATRSRSPRGLRLHTPKHIVPARPKDTRMLLGGPRHSSPSRTGAGCEPHARLPPCLRRTSGGHRNSPSLRSRGRVLLLRAGFRHPSPRVRGPRRHVRGSSARGIRVHIPTVR
jgi:hypothetical protein